MGHCHWCQIQGLMRHKRPENKTERPQAGWKAYENSEKEDTDDQFNLMITYQHLK